MTYDESTQSQSPHRLQALLLYATGVMSAGTGLGMVIAPSVSWKLTKVVNGFAAMGLSTGTLLMSGLMLIGMGMLVRILPTGSAPQTIAFEPGPSEEGLSEISTEIRQLAGKMVAVEATTQRFYASLEEVRDRVGDREDLVDAVAKKQNDSLFRLAASLDQLGARLQKHMDTGVKNVLRESRATSDEIRNVLEETRARPIPAEVQDASFAPAALAQQPIAQQPLAPPAPPTAQYSPPAPPAQQLPEQQAQVPPAAIEQPAIDPAYAAYATDESEEEALGETGVRPLSSAASVEGTSGAAPARPTPQSPLPAPELTDEGEGALESLLPDYRVRQALDSNRRPPN